MMQFLRWLWHEAWSGHDWRCESNVWAVGGRRVKLVCDDCGAVLEYQEPGKAPLGPVQ